MALIRDIAIVCWSKNAGPFDLTLDIVFPSDELFDKVAAAGVLCPELYARLYAVPVDSVIFAPYRAARAFKATLPRVTSAGDVGDTDVYGCQQHAPLLDVDIPTVTLADGRAQVPPR